MDPQQQDKVVEFCSITGTTAERAEFFMQAANWDINVCVRFLYVFIHTTHTHSCYDKSVSFQSNQSHSINDEPSNLSHNTPLVSEP